MSNIYSDNYAGNNNNTFKSLFFLKESARPYTRSRPKRNKMADVLDLKEENEEFEVDEEGDRK